ncbi:uncharacterized protein LOC115767283 [Drosophila novamexicana]|uniref:uncharacterized protein LOC115767283 n=1 Tax=Drosophila novamexicana TaxID=47314 RepID=UPI0011E59C06|nr:uncharacterized protein LOC115767283 [Drosophila novamexicana]
MQTLILMLAAKAVPLLALIFVLTLLAYKCYINVRSRFDITVNCWFCNKDLRVPFEQRNSWTCPDCEQYNGFNKDGDYNRDILSQRDCSSRTDANSSRGSSSAARNGHCANAYYANGLTPPQENGLCAQCNEAQRLKIEKLAQFEPRHESRYDQELKVYQNELEQRYRLCASCERHVNKVLHEKKKMVLGSKFLNFIMKGAALLKQPHFQRLARAQQQRRLARYRRLMKWLTLINIVCLVCSLPTATPEQFSCMLGILAKPFFFVYSHALTVLHLLFDYAGELLTEQPFAAKLLLFANILGKLLVYSVGMNQTQAGQATFSVCYTSLYPYAMLGLSFISNLIYGFKLTRYTVLLLLWSIYAKGSFLLVEAIDGVTYILLGSVATMLLLSSKQTDSLEQMSAGESFHRLCADECIHDDETISMLSQQLNCQNASNATNNTTANLSLPGSGCSSPQLRSLGGGQGSSHTVVGAPPPSVLSLDSLRLSTQHTPINRMLASPAPMYAAGSLDQQAWRSSYAAVQHTDALNLGQPGANGWQRAVYATGLEQRPQSSYGFGLDQRPMTRSTNNLLFPPRLQMQQQQRNGDISAWVNAASASAHPDLLQEPSTANLMHCSYNRDLSRTSSQSSGFESQLGNNNLAARPDVPMPQPFWALPAAPQELQQQQLNPTGVMRDFVWPEQRQLRVPPAPGSPYAVQSELGRSAAAKSQNDYRPGDLLRNWMDRNGVATQKTNG